MKNLFTAALFLVAMSFQLQVKAGQVESVSSVNLDLFIGSWYEIASIPQFFQKNCAKNTVANYSLDEHGGINVVNTCTKADGQFISANGKAKVFDQTTNAKLSVTFFKLGVWIYPVPGNYWIIDLAPDYRYAVIGDKNGTYGWILSRNPRMEESDLVSAMKALQKNGYDLCRFNLTPQDGGTAIKINLCDIAPSL
jgi:apolipoprotein D and lipocalin family protein